MGLRVYALATLVSFAIVGAINVEAGDKSPTLEFLVVDRATVISWVRPPYEKSKVSISKENRRLSHMTVSVSDGALDLTAKLPAAFFDAFPDPKLRTLRILDSISEGSGVGIQFRLKYGPAVAVAREDGDCRIVTSEAGAIERADSHVEYATAEIYVDLLEDRTLSVSRRDACFNPDEWEEEFALREDEHLTGTGWRAFQERIDRKRRDDALELEERGLDEIMVYTVTPKPVVWESVAIRGRFQANQTPFEFGAKRAGPGFPATDRSNIHADLYGGALNEFWIRLDQGEKVYLPKPFLSQFDRPMLDSLRLGISSVPSAGGPVQLKASFRYGLAWRTGTPKKNCEVTPYTDGIDPPSTESVLEVNTAQVNLDANGNILGVVKRDPCGATL